MWLFCHTKKGGIDVADHRKRKLFFQFHPPNDCFHLRIPQFPPCALVELNLDSMITHFKARATQPLVSSDVEDSHSGWLKCLLTKSETQVSKLMMKSPIRQTNKQAMTCFCCVLWKRRCSQHDTFAFFETIPTSMHNRSIRTAGPTQWWAFNNVAKKCAQKRDNNNLWSLQKKWVWNWHIGQMECCWWGFASKGMKKTRWKPKLLTDGWQKMNCSIQSRCLRSAMIHSERTCESPCQLCNQLKCRQQNQAKQIIKWAIFNEDSNKQKSRRKRRTEIMTKKIGDGKTEQKLLKVQFAIENLLEQSWHCVNPMQGNNLPDQNVEHSMLHCDDPTAGLLATETRN